MDLRMVPPGVVSVAGGPDAVCRDLSDYTLRRNIARAVALPCAARGATRRPPGSPHERIVRCPGTARALAAGAQARAAFSLARWRRSIARRRIHRRGIRVRGDAARG